MNKWNSENKIRHPLRDFQTFLAEGIVIGFNEIPAGML